MTSSRPVSVVVAGHVCLDLIPDFGDPQAGLEALMVPGKLVEVGPAIITPGGSVSNTGLALHRLGVRVKLMGKVGNDHFGHELRRLFNSHGRELGDGLIVAPGEATAYSIIVTLPGIDRIFFHCSGANDTFVAADVSTQALANASIFHFGYPPIMRRFYLDDGAELVALLHRVKAAGLTTSLDMAYPDPDSAAGQIDWLAWLGRVLPHVDLFLPSFEEIHFMLSGSTTPGTLSGAQLAETAGRLLEMGTAVVVLKLGAQGLYLRSSADPTRLATAGLDERWRNRHLLAPCYRADLVGTTGAGDCTIAGFLAGLLQEQGPSTVINRAVAVGAFNVESADATSGIPPWETVEARVAAGWPRRQTEVALDGWRWQPAKEIWTGPGDTV